MFIDVRDEKLVLVLVQGGRDDESVVVLDLSLLTSTVDHLLRVLIKLSTDYIGVTFGSRSMSG